MSGCKLVAFGATQGVSFHQIDKGKLVHFMFDGKGVGKWW